LIGRCRHRPINYLGKFLKEDISLNDKDPTDLNNHDLDEQHYKLLPLDSYDIDEDEKDLYQSRYDYANLNKIDFYFNNEDINIDEDYDSLQENSPPPSPLYLELLTKTFDFYNIVPRNSSQYKIRIPTFKTNNNKN
jgi:hypothetical protein